MGCKSASCTPKPASLSPESLASERTIEKLLENQAVVGSDVAARLKLKPGASIELLGAKFEVLAVLPPTGTVDDSRIFAHLHTVQKLAHAGEVVSAIEVLGCCEDAAGQLVPELSKLLPDCKVVTISQVVQTQVGVNRLMARASLVVLVVLTLLGGASVLSTISSNVRERRREIGTLMALGATPGFRIAAVPAQGDVAGHRGRRWRDGRWHGPCRLARSAVGRGACLAAAACGDCGVRCGLCRDADSSLLAGTTGRPTRSLHLLPGDLADVSS